VALKQSALTQCAQALLHAYCAAEPRTAACILCCCKHTATGVARKQNQQWLLHLSHLELAALSFTMCSAPLLCQPPVQAMQALPCPKGTYKTGTNRQTTCTPCPKGISTAGVASSSGTACDRANTGYRPVRSSGPAGQVILSAVPCEKVRTARQYSMPFLAASPPRHIHLPSLLPGAVINACALCLCLCPAGYLWCRWAQLHPLSKQSHNHGACAHESCRLHGWSWIWLLPHRQG
jgi:hypothetical protein